MTPTAQMLFFLFVLCNRCKQCCFLHPSSFQLPCKKCQIEGEGRFCRNQKTFKLKVWASFPGRPHFSKQREHYEDGLCAKNAHASWFRQQEGQGAMSACETAGHSRLSGVKERNLPPHWCFDRSRHHRKPYLLEMHMPQCEPAAVESLCQVLTSNTSTAPLCQ